MHYLLAGAARTLTQVDQISYCVKEAVVYTNLGGLLLGRHGLCPLVRNKRDWVGGNGSCVRHPRGIHSQQTTIFFVDHYRKMRPELDGLHARRISHLARKQVKVSRLDMQ